MKRFRQYEIAGDTVIGQAEVLLHMDEDLTQQTFWAQQGYAVTPLLSASEFATLRQGIQHILQRLVQAQGVDVVDEEDLTHYHRWIRHDEALHYAIAKWGLPLSELPMDPAILTQRISDRVGIPLRIKKLPNASEIVFGFRVVRPGSSDESPFHRDAWQSFWRHTLNVWIPVAGCDAQSTLSVVPGSHRWPESDVERTVEGALVNGRQYRVPAVVSILRPFEVMQPNPSYTEALLFSPYLIHGGGSNQNPDQTRISIELRFERIP